jgi:hypothetical protein
VLGFGEWNGVGDETDWRARQRKSGAKNFWAARIIGTAAARVKLCEETQKDGQKFDPPLTWAYM